MTSLLLTIFACVAVWYLGRATRQIPSWRKIRVNVGAKPWMAAGATGTLPPTKRHPEGREAPRLSTIDREGRKALWVGYSACAHSFLIIWAYAGFFFEVGPGSWMWVAVPFTFTHVLTSLATLRSGMLFSQLVPVVAAPAIRGVFFDYGVKPATAPEEKTAAEPKPEEESTRPVFQLRMPEEEDIDDAASASSA